MVGCCLARSAIMKQETCRLRLKNISLPRVSQSTVLPLPHSTRLYSRNLTLHRHSCNGKSLDAPLRRADIERMATVSLTDEAAEALEGLPTPIQTGIVR